MHACRTSVGNPGAYSSTDEDLNEWLIELAPALETEMGVLRNSNKLAQRIQMIFPETSLTCEVYKLG